MSAVTDQYGAKKATESDSESDSEDSEDEDRVGDFLLQMKQEERKAEVDRILKSLKINPLEILDVRTDSTAQEVKKTYRTISLKVHPDKCDVSFRPLAEKAFSMLQEAKTNLLDETKRGQYNQIIMEARAKVTAVKAQEFRKARKLECQQKGLLFSVKDVPDPARMPEFEGWVKKKFRDLLIEREWNKRQLLKHAQKQEQHEEQKLKQMVKEADLKEQKDKQWEDGRERRVGLWRSFQTGGKGVYAMARGVGLKTKKDKKSKKKGKKRKLRPGIELRMPKTAKKDKDKTFVARPVMRG